MLIGVNVPPQQVRLDALITTQKTLDLETLLAEDSTFYGGHLLPHVVEWGVRKLYLGGRACTARCVTPCAPPRRHVRAGAGPGLQLPGT